MTKQALREFAQFCLAVARRFLEDRSLETAGSLTYTTILALVPLATVVLTISTALPGFDQLVSSLQDFVLDHVLPDTPGLDKFTEQLNYFTERAGRMRAVGFGALGLTALMMMYTIDDALNRIFRVAQQRAFARRVILYITLLVLGPLLIGGSISMTTFLVAESLGALNLDALAEAVLRFLPFVLTCAAFTLLYGVVPNRPVACRHALIGGFFAGIAFEVAKRGVALYVSEFPSYEVIYGTFAILLLFLLWMYVSWLVVLAGATLTAMLPTLRERDILKEPT